MQSGDIPDEAKATASSELESDDLGVTMPKIW